MFVTSDAARIELEQQGLSAWSWMRLFAVAPVFIVLLDVEDSAGTTHRIVFFEFPDQVEQMLNDDDPSLSARCVYVLSPGDFNGSADWQLHRLEALWSSPSTKAHRCVMTDGTTIYSEPPGDHPERFEWSRVASC